MFQPARPVLRAIARLPILHFGVMAVESSAGTSFLRTFGCSDNGVVIHHVGMFLAAGIEGDYILGGIVGAWGDRVVGGRWVMVNVFQGDGELGTL